jgi:spore germination cell wall hydrolase CwlJ-like protein
VWIAVGLSVAVLAAFGIFDYPAVDRLRAAAMEALTPANGPAAIKPPKAVPSLSAAAAAVVLQPSQQGWAPMTPDQARAINAANPFSTAPVQPARPFILRAASPADRARAIECLTSAIYYEAGGDVVDDQRAVAQVVLNRVRHPLFPKTVCGVVFQGSSLKTGCQFTFTCDGSMARIPDRRGLTRDRVIATDALNGAVFAPVGYATHFHTPAVAPYWMPSLVKITQVGGHLFYRWPGGLGSPAAYGANYFGGEILPASLAAPASASDKITPAEVAAVKPPKRIEVALVQATTPAHDLETAPIVAPALASVRLDDPRAITRAAVQNYHPPRAPGGLAQPLRPGSR